MYRIKNLKKSYVSFGVLAFAIGLLALVFTFSSKNVDTESFAKKSETKVVKKVTKSKVEKSSSSSEKKKPEASSSQTEQSSSIEVTAATPAEVAPATEETVPAEQVQAAPAAQATQVQQYASTPAYPSNGNTAGVVGSQAAAQMAAATGVPQATWETIIARESNGNPNVANASGASGLFQTMPGWGSTATVQDQVNSAIKAYNTQGMSAWGY
ncbi:transglycosylase SLT domain-containing protein [Streptococcus parauberis]|uniref:Transglycosylase-like domain protein n=1 Tax=Streptococcus parauberis NCFD 2020 TaxID=873447 RepID=F1Z1J8_9STRE|nr:transglycosylase SLT domain-containing protein [Streptococcus parauberis]EGE54671.1 Transglycosylase-like domain protein [Streptococcus parauberis NCFD 2020]